MLSSFLMRSGVNAEVPSPWVATVVLVEGAVEHVRSPLSAIEISRQTLLT